ncbi:MAG: LUD domain-containing protein [Bacteroidia bacterium]|nr:LUD domain-containing protein [Bacteroidia bacterium]
MQESTNREKVLKKIRKALIHKTANPFPNVEFETSVYPKSSEPLEVIFAHEFTRNGGHFIFCEHESDLLLNLTAFVKEISAKKVFASDAVISSYLEKAGIKFSTDEKNLLEGDVSFTKCEALMARTGTVLVSSKLTGGRKSAVASPVHAVIAFASQLIPDIQEAMLLMKQRYHQQLPSMFSLLSGPSRTADIEKTLVTGAHGPKAIYVFLLDDTLTSI